MKLLTPKIDFVFKKLFCNDTEILTDLINSVLKLPKARRIRYVEVKNPLILPEEITQKYIMLDILATDESGCRYDIEMQARRYASYPKRSLYYVSRLYAGQLGSGENYEELKPVIGIHFLDYEEFPDYPDFHFCFELRDVRYPEIRLTDDMSMHIFELPKFEKMRKDDRFKDKMMEWLYFFNHAQEEDRNMREHYTNPAIHKAFNVLETLSADDKNRMLAEIREKAMINEAIEKSALIKEGLEKGLRQGEKKGLRKGLKEGSRKGKLIGKIHFAQRLLKRPLTPEKKLLEQAVKDLGAILKTLEAELNLF